jgi:hypothetical protein
MNREVQSSRRTALFAAVSCAVVVLFSAANIATQSRIIKSQPAGNTNNANKRQRVATLRASDSPDGSRVALSSDQSLNDYEAYRRGDRFYVRIPPSDVPRAEIVRGRAFGDVKVQRGADGTVLSFRLQPGATARVEQSGNKLDVVFKMPGGSTAATNSNRGVARNNAGPSPPMNSNRRAPSNTNTSTQPGSLRGSANKNSSDRTNTASTKPSPLPTPKATPKPTPSPAASPAIAKASPSAQTSPAAKASPAVAQVKSSPAATSLQSQPVAQGSTWSKLKERARYWLLLAQLNPLPVAIGVGVLLLLLGLFVIQRRRARATKRARPRKEPKKVTPVVETAQAVVEPAKSSTLPVAETAAVVGAAAVASSLVAAKPGSEAAAAPRANGDRHERVTRVSEEVKKIMAGGDYDESVIASDDPDTRKLVGAELLSALVGRNLQRRERARNAFMKHGYFDDATRDLRTAESANERAAAARRLSFVHEREATPHLIGGLEDPSPDVRRASVEALMDLRDPAAIAPLNSLMQTETDRKVPRTLLKHAIEACATGGANADEPLVETTTPAPASISQTTETEREVIEI